MLHLDATHQLLRYDRPRSPRDTQRLFAPCFGYRFLYNLIRIRHSSSTTAQGASLYPLPGYPLAGTHRYPPFTRIRPLYTSGKGGVPVSQ